MTSYIKSYLKHARSQSDEIKNLHSVLIAGAMTGVFIVIYLYLVRGVAPPIPENIYTSPVLNAERVYEKGKNN